MLTKLSRDHPINATPFEAFYLGSWHGVDHISIKSGSIFVQLKYDGVTVEDNIHGDCLRIRSRRANAVDCANFLKAGVDVCVLSARPVAASSEQQAPAPVHLWRDAKISSVKRTPHGDRCSCLFSVVFYKNDPLMKKSMTDRRPEVVMIDNISILQKLQSEPKEDGYYIWNSTEDCISSNKSKLLTDTVSCEISWLIILSTLKKMDFEVKLVENKIVYQITDNDQSLPSTSNSCETVKIVHFRRRDDTMRPKIETLKVVAPKEMTSEKKDLEVAVIENKVEDDSDVEILYNRTNLRRSKRLKVEPDRFTSYDSPNFGRFTITDTDDDSDGEMQEALLGSSLPLLEYKPISEVQENEVVISSSQRISHGGNLLTYERRHFGARLHRKKSKHRKKRFTTTECKEFIDKCIGNIKCEIDKKSEPFAQKTANQPTADLEEEENFNWSPSREIQVEEEEHAELWKEMEHSLMTLALLEQKQVLDSELPAKNSERDEQQQCQHEYMLNEQTGLICRLCNFICTEIRYIYPPLLRTDGRLTLRERVDVGPFQYHDLEIDAFRKYISSWDILQAEGCKDIWSSIPDLKEVLHSHQKRAFEFIWRNVAGSLEPEEMNHLSDNTGGCVISHSPGSGKTLLIISFLSSYLTLYPRSRPLVLSPKTAVHTWRKEFLKWRVPIPLYLIQQDESFRKEVEDRKTTSFSRRPNRKMSRIMDSLEKIRRWHEQPSVLLMTYSSFLMLTKEDTKVEYKTFMANVLQNSPGLLILDEGHNPRSTRSKLRKLLMKVKTEFRVLLSGTLFQNNFEEYFNTLSLARPRFIGDVLGALDPRMVSLSKSRKRKLLSKSIARKEIIARKLFVETVGQKIESSEEQERKKGFDLLNRVTGGFIDVYEGGKSNMLPGLQIYTLFMASTDIQQEILTRLQNLVKTQKRYPLELELLITVCSIHPWLIKTVACVDNFFSQEELDKIEKYKGNFNCGSKAKFVIDLVHKSTLRGERVLVFCHNISP
nr:unnamed protein product [Ananas comosus var. bracteatus]